MQFHLQSYQKYGILRHESCINDVQDLYTENYNTLLKKDLNKSRDIPHSWVGILNIVKMAVIYK